MSIKKQIKPKYHELQGYLEQTPEPDYPEHAMQNAASWEQVNSTIDEIQIITGEDYSKFRIITFHDVNWGESVNIVGYRQKISGLIQYLYGKYFSDDSPPFSCGPTTSIVQNQSQVQTVHQELILDLGTRIRDATNSEDTDEEEKRFLTTLRKNLPAVKTGIEVLNLVIATAARYGITPERLTHLLNFS